MKINICCVNYNSYVNLINYVNSIDHALKTIIDIDLHVYICDNSDKKKLYRLSYSFPIDIIESSNIGYFNGIKRIISKFPEVLECDYFIISNVDLEIDKNFFYNLKNTLCEKNEGCLAPVILSKRDSLNKNPKIINRYTKYQLKFIKLMYDIPVFYYLYRYFFHKLRRKKRINFSGGTFYAPHGSFIILTNQFLRNNHGVNYPIFLFGEEIYIAECLLKHKMIVKNHEDLIVYDAEHISTSKIKSKFYFKYNSEALKYILDTFYE